VAPTVLPCAGRSGAAPPPNSLSANTLSFYKRRACCPCHGTFSSQIYHLVICHAASGGGGSIPGAAGRCRAWFCACQRQPPTAHMPLGRHRAGAWYRRDQAGERGAVLAISLTLYGEKPSRNTCAYTTAPARLVRRNACNALAPLGSPGTFRTHADHCLRRYLQRHLLPSHISLPVSATLTLLFSYLPRADLHALHLGTGQGRAAHSFCLACLIHALLHGRFHRRASCACAFPSSILWEEGGRRRETGRTWGGRRRKRRKERKTSIANCAPLSCGQDSQLPGQHFSPVYGIMLVDSICHGFH